MSQYVKQLLELSTSASGTTVSVSNHPTSFEVSNHPTSFEVSNHPTTIEVSNHPATIEVSNHPTTTEVSNFPASQVVSGSVSVSNHPTTIEVSNLPGTSITRETTIITNDFGGDALSGSLADGKETAYWATENYIKFQAVISGTAGGYGQLRVQGSQTTDDEDFVDIDEAYELGVGSSFLYRWDTTNAFYRYYRFKNSTLSSISFSSIQVHFLK